MYLKTNYLLAMNDASVNREQLTVTITKENPWMPLANSFYVACRFIFFFTESTRVA